MEDWKNNVFVLMMGALVGILSQLGRMISDERTFSMRRILGGLLGSGMVAFVSGALLRGIYPDASFNLTLGVAGILGWAGGDAFGLLFEALAKRAGLKDGSK